MMTSDMTLIKKKLFLFFLEIVVIFCYYCFSSSALYSVSDRLFIFSSRIENEKNSLLVVKNNSVFIRKITGRIFEYKVPEDKCFKLLNNAVVCVKNGEITSIDGVPYNVGHDFKIKTNKFADEFFSESNNDCNSMKFDIINKLFVRKEHINGFPTQLYLPGYYNVLRLYLYTDDFSEKNDVKVFVVSENNDVGCSLFYDFKIYKSKLDDYQYNKNKKNSKKKIEAKTEYEFFKKLSTESYKTMLLDGYLYLEPIKRNAHVDADKIVLSVNNNKVTYFNTIALDLKWIDIGFEDVFSKELRLAEDKKDNLATSRKANMSKRSMTKK